MNHFIITGGVRGGKTTFALKLSEILKKKGSEIGGFLSPGSFKNGERAGFEILSLLTGEKKPLAVRASGINGPVFGGFSFFQKALDFGRELYEKSAAKPCDFIFIDEIGRWELEGGGWRELLMKTPDRSFLIIISRDKFADDINGEFFGGEAIKIDVSAFPENAVEKISNHATRLKNEER